MKSKQEKFPETEKIINAGSRKCVDRMGIFALFLTIAWMVFIFSMSAQPGDVSGDLSGSISHVFAQTINTIFGCGWNEAELLQVAAVWDYPIRKLAHMTEFGILALLYLWVLHQYENAEKSANTWENIPHYIIAFLCTVLYASTDEFHQLFVPGRAGMVTDVLIDALGAVIALVFFGAASATISKLHLQRNKKSLKNR